MSLADNIAVEGAMKELLQFMNNLSNSSHNTEKQLECIKVYAEGIQKACKSGWY